MLNNLFNFKTKKKKNKNIIKKNKILLKNTNINLTNKIQKNINVKADKLRLNELFNNLLINSIGLITCSITLSAKIISNLCCVANSSFIICEFLS